VTPVIRAKAKIPPPPGEFYPDFEIERRPGQMFVPSVENDYRILEAEELERLLRSTLLEGIFWGSIAAVILSGLIVGVVNAVRG